jgi:hypothetical protein
MNMRKGFSLIELIVIIAILPFVFIVIDGLIATMFSDIPRSVKTIQNNSILLDMTEQLQEDIDAAKDLPESIDGYTAGNELLLIKLADSVIHYQIKDGQIRRCSFAENQQNIPEQTRLWSMPEVKIKWHVRRKNNKGYAVEVEHHIEYTLRGHLIKKMANSNMYFVGTFE